MGRQSIFPVRTARARCPARIDIVQSIDAPFSPGLRPIRLFRYPAGAARAPAHGSLLGRVAPSRPAFRTPSSNWKCNNTAEGKNQISDILVNVFIDNEDVRKRALTGSAHEPATRDSSGRVAP